MSSLTPAEIFYEKAHASDNLQPNMIAIDVCGIVLPYIAVILRFITRKKSAVLGMDDWLIFAALVCSPQTLYLSARGGRMTELYLQFPLTGYSIASGLAIHFGEGRHIIFLQNARSYVEVGPPSNNSFLYQDDSFRFPGLYCHHYDLRTLHYPHQDLYPLLLQPDLPFFRAPPHLLGYRNHCGTLQRGIGAYNCTGVHTSFHYMDAEAREMHRDATDHISFSVCTYFALIFSHFGQHELTTPVL